MPIIAHPTSGLSMYGVGLPVGLTLKIRQEVKNVVGWKMTYSYYGWKTVAEGLRILDHHVGILGAPSDLWHVFFYKRDV
ncbi:MAG: hypothetical protein N2596_00810 [Syntrophorhabdaceae bacterium]|nr:hypothetical protein [Syntrophorhabdaceae bacterium]